MPNFDLTQVLMMPWAIPVIMGCMIAIVAIVGGLVSSCITDLAETNLKRSMVERGFSAAEIERVVQASAGEKPCKPAPIATEYAKPSS
jgi:hypothetical protein